MKALVTGAHGSIGSYLCEHLLAEGHSVRALVSPWGELDNLARVLVHPAFSLVRADLTRPESLAGSCEGVEVVFHAAARVAEWGPWRVFYETNVRGTENLLAAAKQGGARRFVQVSSVSVHRYTGFRDADPRTLPRDGDVMAYAVSKRLAEDAVRAAEGIETVIVRPGLHLLSPRDPLLLRQARALKRGLLPMVDGFRTVVNTAYVGNLVHGLRLAGTMPGVSGRSYVIADEGCPTLREIFGLMAELLEAPKPRLNLPGPLAAGLGRTVEGTWARLLPGRKPPLVFYMAYAVLNDVHFSLEAARQELGYAPRWSWQDGVARTVAELKAGL